MPSFSVYGALVACCVALVGCGVAVWKLRRNQKKAFGVKSIEVNVSYDQMVTVEQCTQEIVNGHQTMTIRQGDLLVSFSSSGEGYPLVNNPVSTKRIHKEDGRDFHMVMVTPLEGQSFFFVNGYDSLVDWEIYRTSSNKNVFGAEDSTWTMSANPHNSKFLFFTPEIGMDQTLTMHIYPVYREKDSSRQMYYVGPTSEDGENVGFHVDLKWKDPQEGSDCVGFGSGQYRDSRTILVSGGVTGMF